MRKEGYLSTAISKNDAARWKLAIASALVSIILIGCSVESTPSPKESPVPESNMVESENSQRLPTPSAKFSTPWPTNVTAAELTDTALFETYSYFEATRQSNCDAEHIVHLGETISNENKTSIELFVEQTVEIYCEHFRNPVIFISGNNDFVLSTVAENNYPSDEYGGICGYEVPNDANGGCAFYDIAWVGDKWQSPPSNQYAIVAHEIFHIVQYNLDPEPGAQIPGPGHPLFRPVWLIEGAGDYFGRAVASYLGFSSYGREVPRTTNGEFLEVSYLSDLDLLEEWQDRASRGENYFSGQRAMEYIVASKGANSVIELTKKLGSGAKFEKAFEETMDISVTEFYLKFQELYENMYSNGIVDN